jgi:hypothetical protein
LTLYARAVESSGTVATVEFFAGSASLGAVSNGSQMVFTNVSSEPLFPLAWSNVVAGTYAIRAVATDALGNAATSSVVNISVVSNSPPTNIPFVVSFWYPTNGQSFVAPATVGVHALVTDSNIVQTVQYFSGATSIGTVTNTKAVLLTNTTAGNPFFMGWSNVPAGNFSLTAVATDSVGNTATSAPVTIHVTNAPPPVVRPSVYIYSPTNYAVYSPPANLILYARAVESAGTVATVQFFAGSASLGVVSNGIQMVFTNVSSEPLFALAWSNVVAGTYAIRAVATDTLGNAATSSVVNISVVSNSPPTNIPFVVSFWYPTNGQSFVAPATVGVHALVTDSNVVQTVRYFSGATSIGIVTNTNGVPLANTSAGNPFFMGWSNVPAGNYSLTAVATDSAGNTATSAPVNIYVLSNLPPAVSIYASDPVAIEGTNTTNWYPLPVVPAAGISGGNTATFLLSRDGQTNADLTVYYSIGGTASNGVDYAAIPNNVTIAAGQRYALVTVVPLNDNDSAYRSSDTVVLGLTVPSNAPPPYRIGSQSKAGAIILEETLVPVVLPTVRNLSGDSVYVSLPASNGMNYSLQTSSDLLNWQPVSTNTVLKGSAQFVDPYGAANSRLFYRIVPAAGPADY